MTWVPTASTTSESYETSAPDGSAVKRDFLPFPPLVIVSSSSPFSSRGLLCLPSPDKARQACRFRGRLGGGRRYSGAPASSGPSRLTTRQYEPRALLIFYLLRPPWPVGCTSLFFCTRHDTTKAGSVASRHVSRLLRMMSLRCSALIPRRRTMGLAASGSPGADTHSRMDRNRAERDAPPPPGPERESEQGNWAKSKATREGGGNALLS